MEESKKCEEIPRCLQGKGQKELEESDNQKDSGHIKESENIYVIDQIKDIKNTDETWTEKMTIESALNKLNEKEQIIVSKRFFDGRTQMEVAEEIGISQAQVSRLEKSAIEHIKRFYK